MGKMRSPMRNKRFRPQWSACAPTSRAIGTMTICAATMQADIRLVPKFLSCNASFWPTSGSMAALAKWNRTAQAAKISNGRQVISTFSRHGKDADEACNRHCCQHKENHHRPPNIGGDAGCRGREGIARMIERLVAADAACEGLVPHHAERDCSDRWREYGSGGMCCRLRKGNR